MSQAASRIRARVPITGGINLFFVLFVPIFLMSFRGCF
jgi:hypothetical protein